MAYDNNADRLTYVAYTTPTATTFSYASIPLDDRLTDQDQLIVLRKFPVSDDFLASDLGGVPLDGAETWAAWTLPASSASGSPQYTIDESAKTITMSTDASDYVYDRNGTQVQLPVYTTGSDTIIIMRKTYGLASFVNWLSGQRLTLKQIDLSTDQLIHLVQESLTSKNQRSLLDPYLGAANGYAPLNSLGKLDQDYFSISALSNALSDAWGDGLSGSLESAVNVDLATNSGLGFTGGSLDIILPDNSLVKDGTGLYVKIDSGECLSVSGDGLKVDKVTTRNSGSNDHSSVATAGSVYALGQEVDALTGGVTYRGAIDLGLGIPAEPSFGLPQTGDTWDIYDTVPGVSPSDGDTNTTWSGNNFVYYVPGQVRYDGDNWISIDLNAGEFLPLDGSQVMTGDIDMDNANTIIQLPAPSVATDAATKGYVDTNLPTVLNDFTDCNVPGPSDGQFLTWDDTPGEWVATAANITDLDALTDVDLTVPPETGDYLSYNGTNWVALTSLVSPEHYTFAGNDTTTYPWTSSTSGKTDPPSGEQEKAWIVSIDGVIQIPNTDYSVNSVNLVFASEVPPNAVITAINLGGTVSLSAPAAGSVQHTSLDAGLQAALGAGAINYVHNGNFRLWQRGVSFLSAANGQYLTDRWSILNNTVYLGDIQNPGWTAGLPSSCRNVMQLDTGGAGVDVGATDADGLVGFRHAIEGYDFQKFHNKQVTLSFWSKTANAGEKFSVQVSNGIDKFLYKEFTTTTGGAWQQNSLTFTTPTAGTWNFTNGAGLIIKICVAVGANYVDNTSSQETWLGVNDAADGSVFADEVTEDNLSYFTFGQVQLVPGDTILEFSDVDIADEIARCQRFYQKSYNLDVVPGTVTSAGSVAHWSGSNNTVFGMSVPFKVTMNDTPTCVVYSPLSGISGFLAQESSVDVAAAADNIGTSNFVIGPNGDVLKGNNIKIIAHYTAESEI